MQTGSEQIKRQQEIMQAKGFYTGKLDGIWGPKSIEAKKKWEVHPSFAPGLPNLGMPFANKGPHPVGVVLNRLTGLLTCAELELKKSQKETQNKEPSVKVKAAESASSSE